MGTSDNFYLSRRSVLAKKMTDRIEAAANKVASDGTRIVATNPKNGPESIEG